VTPHKPVIAMDSLQATCLALLFSTQSHPVGFFALHVEQDASLASALSDKEQQLLALHEKLQRVSLQRRTLEAELTAAIGKQLLATHTLRLFFFFFLLYIPFLFFVIEGLPAFVDDYWST
jgi:hypothetical protein